MERTQVGDRYVVEKMRAEGYNLGGEQSGHVVLSDFSTTGDGMVAALQLLAAVVQSERPASEIANVFTPAPQKLINVHFGEKDPLEDEKVKALIAIAPSLRAISRPISILTVRSIRIVDVSTVASTALPGRRILTLGILQGLILKQSSMPSEVLHSYLRMNCLTAAIVVSRLLSVSTQTPINRLKKSCV